MATFGSWLTEQKARSDGVGELSRWWEANKIPKVHSLSGIERHTPAELKDALTQAAHEHQSMRLAEMQADQQRPLQAVPDQPPTTNSAQTAAYIAAPPPGFVSGALPQSQPGAADAADLGLQDPAAAERTAGSPPEPQSAAERRERSIATTPIVSQRQDQLDRIERGLAILLATMGLPVEEAEQVEYLARITELGADATTEEVLDAMGADPETQRALGELMPATPEWWWLAASLADFRAESA
jgi:hypothetical protein